MSVIHRSADQQHYPEETNLIRPHGFRRRSYAANDLTQLVVSGLSQYNRDLPHTAPAVSYTHTSYLPPPVYIPTVEPIPAVEEHSLEDYGARPVSHDMTPRPYSAQPVPRHFYEKPSPFFFNPYPNDEYLSSDADGGVAQMYYRADRQIGLC
jgi:hypothetical protein